jgi:hypothetical protein
MAVPGRTSVGPGGPAESHEKDSPFYSDGPDSAKKADTPDTEVAFVMFERLRFGIGGVVEIGATKFHQYNHRWILSARFSSDQPLSQRTIRHEHDLRLKPAVTTRSVGSGLVTCCSERIGPRPHVVRASGGRQGAQSTRLNNLAPEKNLSYSAVGNGIASSVVGCAARLRGREVIATVCATLHRGVSLELADFNYLN